MFKVYEKTNQDSFLIGKYCDDTLPAPILSNENEIYIVFESNLMTEGLGFQIYYEASKL